MNVQRFRVYTTHPELGTPPAETPPTAYDLSVLPVDRMMAERSATSVLPPSQRGPNASQLHANTWVLLWLWCSAKRHNLTAEAFDAWAATVLDFDRLDAAGELVPDGTAPDDVEDPTLDPTNRAGATG